MDAAITEYDVIVYTEAFRAADIENTYYVEDALYELSGELLGYENVKKMEYVLTDANGYILSEGTVFDLGEGKQPMERWDISDFGLAIGCNILNFKLTLKDDTIIEEGVTFIDLYGMSMERVDVDLSDTDGDGLNNYFESVLQTNPQLMDTDEDTLSDYDEFILFGTDPTLADSDGNGVRDSKEDNDGDGLNTIEEKAYGTNIALIDSDYDGVDDGIEVRQLSSNPTVEDTDGDGLLDGEEYSMGLSPIWPDTDGDDVLDYDEVILQTTSIAFEEVICVEKIDVTLECAGAIQNEVYIEDMTGRNSLSCDVVGLIGAPINIHTDVDFDEAKITFHYEPAELGNIVEENLGVLWYDEANNQFVVMDNVFVDTERNTVTCITTHFSEYMLVDKEEWYSVWMQASEYVPVYEPCDIAIMSDASAPSYHYATRGYGYINFPNGYIEGENIIYGYFNSKGASVSGPAWSQNEKQYRSAFQSIFYYHFILTGSHKKAGDGKYGDGFVKMVEMFSDSKYQMLHSDNPKVVLFTYGGSILETEEQNQKVEESVEKLKRMGVTVYAVSETDETSSIIENAAIATGGEHFNACTQEETKEIWLTIHEKMTDLDKDTDEDGLPDVYEINGMRVPNGRVIKTDPNNPDSDGDDRTDGEEMGELVDIVVEVDGEGTKKTFQVYKWVSDPNVGDTLSGGFIYVDGMDYMPYSNILNNQIYYEQVVFTKADGKEVFYPIDREDQYIYGGINIHNSLDFSLPGETPVSEYDNIEKLYKKYNDWLFRIYVFKYSGMISGYPLISVPVDLLEHFISNKGTDYVYDGTEIKCDNLKINILHNLYQLKAQCFTILEEGESRHIATSPDADVAALNIEDIMMAIQNFNAHTAVNSGRAALVAECEFDGKVYKIHFKYYILDYYDWDPFKQLALYNLNVYGLANTFYSVGVLEGDATFTTDPNSEIEIDIEW